MCLQFGFVIFWQKDFGTKAAHKMLTKLTLSHRKLAAENGGENLVVSPVCLEEVGVLLIFNA